MNLAVMVPGDFYAVRHADGWVTHGFDLASLASDLTEACVEHVVVAVPRRTRSCWTRLLKQLREAAIVVDLIPEAEWQEFLTEKEIDSISFPTIDNERAMLAGWLVEYLHVRGGR